MRPEIERFVRSLGVYDIPHSGATFGEHLRGTGRILAEAGHPQHVVDAGCLHAIYGTEGFTPPRIPNRYEVRSVIGVEAENLVWLFCAMVRRTLFSPDNIIVLRDGSRRLIFNQESEHLKAMVAANDADMRSRRRGSEGVYPPSVRGSSRSFSRQEWSFIDPQGIIRSHEGQVDLRLMPKSMNNPVFVTQLVSPEEANGYAELVYQAVNSGGAHQSRVFISGTQTAQAPSSRNSMNVDDVRPFEPLYVRLRDMAANAMALYDGGEHEPRAAGRQVLYYGPGGKFDPHSDSTVRLENSGRYTTNTPERHLVTLCWLTSKADAPSRYAFIGGDLVFPHIVNSSTGLPYRVSPRAGLAVAFPANLWYTHGVEPVLEGSRMTVTHWWSVYPF